MLKKLKKNVCFHALIIAVLLIAIVSTLWFGSQVVLNTKILPVMPVKSSSMYIPYGTDCDGGSALTNPFERTLQMGDLIIIQNVDPQDLNADYPNSDIIVFHSSGDPDELIVHRIVTKEEVDGTLYFYTKGDGNPAPKWPDVPTPRTYEPRSWVSQDQIYGKVILRIPWVGYVPMLLQENFGVNNSTAVVGAFIAIAAVLVVLEVTLPRLKRGRLHLKQKNPAKQIAFKKCMCNRGFFDKKMNGKADIPKTSEDNVRTLTFTESKNF